MGSAPDLHDHGSVSVTHLRVDETRHDLVGGVLVEKKKWVVGDCVQYDT